jgi:hypothetical protein
MTHIVVLDRNLVTTLIPSLYPNLHGFVHGQITLATMPSASMYMQLNFIVAKVRHFSSLNKLTIVVVTTLLLLQDTIKESSNVSLAISENSAFLLMCAFQFNKHSLK